MVKPGAYVDLVALQHVRVCEWKSKPCGVCGKPKANRAHSNDDGDHTFVKRVGCLRCGKAKDDPDHIGAPESFNLFTHGSWQAYQHAKRRWHNVLIPLLRESGLPCGLGRIVVEGEASFGDNKRRDQGNHRVVLEKALGDVLVEERYLPDDSWDHYEFGGLTRVEARGVNRIRLTLFPAAPEPAAQLVLGK